MRIVLLGILLSLSVPINITLHMYISTIINVNTDLAYEHIPHVCLSLEYGNKQSKCNITLQHNNDVLLINYLMHNTAIGVSFFRKDMP